MSPTCLYALAGTCAPKQRFLMLENQETINAVSSLSRMVRGPKVPVSLLSSGPYVASRTSPHKSLLSPHWVSSFPPSLANALLTLIVIRVSTARLAYSSPRQPLCIGGGATKFLTHYSPSSPPSDATARNDCGSHLQNGDRPFVGDPGPLVQQCNGERSSFSSLCFFPADGRLHTIQHGYLRPQAQQRYMYPTHSSHPLTIPLLTPPPSLCS